MIVTILKHNSLIKIGEEYYNAAYLGEVEIWTRFALNHLNFLKYDYSNFDLKFKSPPYITGDENAINDQFLKPSWIDDSTPYEPKFDEMIVWNSGEIQIEFSNLITGIVDQSLNNTWLGNVETPGDENAINDQFLKPSWIDDSTPYAPKFNEMIVWNSGEIQIEFNNIITGISDQSLVNTWLENVEIHGDENAINDQFLKPSWIDDSTPYEPKFDEMIVWNSGEIEIEFTNLITGVSDQSLVNTWLENVEIHGDENAVDDQFLKPSWIDDSVPYTPKFDEVLVFTGDSMWDEFWYDVSEIYDQDFILDSSNIVSFFGE